MADEGITNMRNQHRRLCALEQNATSGKFAFGPLEETAAFIQKVIDAENMEPPHFDPNHRPISEVDAFLHEELARINMARQRVAP